MLDRIRRLLTLGYVGILALILVLFGAIVVVIFSDQLTRQQDTQLVEQAEGIAGHVRDHGPGGAKADASLGKPDEEGAPEDRGPGHDPVPYLHSDARTGVVAFVVPPKNPPAGAGNANIYGKVPDPSSPSSSLGLPAIGAAREAEREGVPDTETIDGPQGAVRVVSVPVRGKSGRLIAVVQAAQSRWVVDETVEQLLSALVPVGLVSLLLAGAGGLLMSRRAIRPVRDSFQRQRTFVADASHELKTPLALIKIGAEVIKRHPTDPENEEVVDDQLSEIDRMNALLSDLLLLARLDAGRLDVDDKPFDLSVVAAEAADRFLTRAAEEGVRLEVEVPERLPARGDPAKTGQILGALLDNAIRHTPKGGCVTISGRPLDNAAEASVIDSGTGIAPEHLDHVFDRFYRAEEARSRTGGGTGLGLSIARDLARAQGGDLIGENAPGGGTRGCGAVFRLSLPRR
jgi:signal transduction histidine kinase